MIETIPTTAREIGERDGKRLFQLGGSVLDEDELAKLVAHYKQVETDLMLDRELNLDEPEVGNDVMALAAKDLNSRGILLANASQDELLASLVRVTS